MGKLPTFREVCDNTIAELDRSRGGLSDAGNWLRSDWQDIELTNQAADDRRAAFEHISAAKSLIDRAKNALHHARNEPNK